MKKQFAVVALGLSLLAGCQSLQQKKPDTLYDELGGQAAIEKLVDNYIRDISFDPELVQRFKDTNIKRLRTKLTEQLCNVSGGPCQYTGDSMKVVHHNMHIGEAEFNHFVELLIKAMNQTGIDQRAQNRLLARLAPMRRDIMDQ